MPSSSSISQLASQAEHHFLSRRYAEAVNALRALEDQLNDRKDNRFYQNLALAEHGVLGFARLSELLSRLKELESRAIAQGNDSSTPETVRGNESSSLVTVKYNMAVILASQRRLYAAAAALAPLVHPAKESLDYLSCNILFLYVDVMTSLLFEAISERESTRRLEAICSALAALEKKSQTTHGQTQRDNRSEDGTGEHARESREEGGGQVDKEKVRFRVLLARSYVKIYLGNLKGAKKDVRSAQDVLNKDLRPLPAQNEGDYRSRLGEGYEVPERELDAVANISILSLRAHLEYRRLNFSKAERVLASCQKEGIEEAALLNNMGCIYTLRDKGFIASTYFSRALAASAVARQARGGPRVKPSYHFEILYNAALQLLKLGKPLLAFRCLKQCTSRFSSNPRFWLRLAECCVLHYRQSIETNGSCIIRGVVGLGQQRRILLACEQRRSEAPFSKSFVTDSKDSKPNGSATTLESLSTEAAVSEDISLNYAVICLRNCLHLLSSDHHLDILSGTADKNRQEPPIDPSMYGEPSESAGAAGGEGNEPVAELPRSERLRLSELKTKVAALSLLAYANLGLRDPLQALQAAQRLLALPDCPKHHRLVAGNYAAEALSMLHRPEEAAKFLPTESTVQDPDVGKALRQAVMVNSAIVSIEKKDLSEAGRYSRLAFQEDTSLSEAVRLQVYLCLRARQIGAASEIVQKLYPTELASFLHHRMRERGPE